VSAIRDTHPNGTQLTPTSYWTSYYS